MPKKKGYQQPRGIPGEKKHVPGAPSFAKVKARAHKKLKRRGKRGGGKKKGGKGGQVPVPYTPAR